MTPAQILLVFAVIWGAMIATGFWESYVEGRNAWDKRKLGWKLQIGLFRLSGYHFYLYWVMYPLLLSLPFIFTGWNAELLGVIVSAYATGLIVEDLTWYLVNPAVQVGELYTPFSDYYPWIRIGKHKIIPAGYIAGSAIALISWSFLWK